MLDRFLVWLGAGMVTAGVMAAMVAGADRGKRRQSTRLRRQGDNLRRIGETD
jgi:hypothetical protein